MKTFTNYLGGLAVVVLLGGLWSAAAFGQTTGYSYASVTSTSSETDCNTPATPCTVANALAYIATLDDGPTKKDRYVLAFHVSYSGASVTLPALSVTGDPGNTLNDVTLAAYNMDDGQSNDGYVVPGKLSIGGLTVRARQLTAHAQLSVTVTGIATLTGSANGLQDGTSGENLTWYNNTWDHDSRSETAAIYPDYYAVHSGAALIKGNITLTGKDPVAGNAANLVVSDQDECTYIGDLHIATSGEDKIRVVAGGNICVVHGMKIDGTVEFLGTADDPGELVIRAPWNDPKKEGEVAPSFVHNGTIEGNGKVVFNQEPEYLSEFNITSLSATSYTATETYEGWGLGDVRKALQLSGSGSIEVPVETKSQGGAKIAAGVSIMADVNAKAGVLFLDANVTGDLTVDGPAQVNVGSVTIDGDVTVTHDDFTSVDADRSGTTADDVNRLTPLGLPLIGRWDAVNNTETPTKPIGTGKTWSPDRKVECYGGVPAGVRDVRAKGRNLTTGLHVLKGKRATVMGSVTVDDAQQFADSFKDNSGENSVTLDFTCQGGLIVQGTLTVNALLQAKNAAQILFDGGGDIVLKGPRFDVRGVTQDEFQVKATTAVSSTSGDVCRSTVVHPSLGGSFLEFAGAGRQSIVADDGTMIDFGGAGIKVNKAADTDQLDLRNGARVSVTGVFVNKGVFITNGSLTVTDILHVDQSYGAAGEGNLSGGSNVSPFMDKGAPKRLLLTGNRASIDHKGLGGAHATYKSVTVSLGTASTQWAIQEPYNVTDLHLRQGTLRIADGGSVRSQNATIGNAHVMEVGQGSWTTPSATVTFDGIKTAADISDVVEVYATQKAAVDAKVAVVPTVVVGGCRSGQALMLGKGYTRVDGLTVNDNSSLDFAGQTLVAAGGITLTGVLTDGSDDQSARLYASKSLTITTAGDHNSLGLMTLVVAKKATLALNGRASGSDLPADVKKWHTANVQAVDLEAGAKESERSALALSGFHAVTAGAIDARAYSSVSLNTGVANAKYRAALTVSGALALDKHATVAINRNHLKTMGMFSMADSSVVNLSSLGSGAKGLHEAMGDVMIGMGAMYKMEYQLRSSEDDDDDGKILCAPSTYTAEGGGKEERQGLYFTGQNISSKSKFESGTLTFSGNKDVSASLAEVCNLAMDMAGPNLMVTADKLELGELGRLYLTEGMVNAHVLEKRTWLELQTSGVKGGGSRDSYVSGTHSQMVGDGQSTGGVVKTGDIFALGGATEGVASDTGPLHFYRPMILQFPAVLGNTTMASASYASGMLADSLEWSQDLVVEDVDGASLTLDVLGPLFWKLEVDALPSHNPNLRLAADGLSNVFRIKGLRIIQWDCDGTNPRLAGVYDVYQDPTDDGSEGLNDFINGVPNLTQEGVTLKRCNLFGVAASALENPIHLEEILHGTARVQFIHNVAGGTISTVDVYVDDNRIINDFAFQTALPFGVVAAEAHKVDVVPANAPDNSVPIFSRNIRFRQNMDYHVIAHGNAALGQFNLVVREGVRTSSNVSNTVDFYLVHGAAELGMVDLRTLDPVDNTTVLDLLANNFEFDDVGTYLTLDPGGYNIEVTTANNDTQIDVFRLELQQYADLAFVLSLSGRGKSSADGITLMGVAQDGQPFFPQVITSSETELPTEFALIGNYPNPFNPSTRIAFDLPEAAQVSITVFDLLGRNVLTLPSQALEAGQARSIELNASSLSSGNYFYRVVATGASGRHVESGRMLLIK